MNKKSSNIPISKVKRPTKESELSVQQAQEISAALSALQKLKSKSGPSHAAGAVALLQSWLQDKSGYDEKTWPLVQEGLDQGRVEVGARRLFRD